MMVSGMIRTVFHPLSNWVQRQGSRVGLAPETWPGAVLKLTLLHLSLVYC